jgi:two-component system cell cycle response regulator
MPPRILVIEDNPANMELMLYLLNAFGYDTLAAFDGEEGVTVALRERPDLIICDLQLPKLHGLEVAQRLKSHPLFLQVPIVAVTAFAMVGDRDRVLSAGFDGYIAKPIIPGSFVPDVEAFLTPSDGLTRGQLACLSVNACSNETPPMLAAAQPRILAVDNSYVNLSLVRSTLEPLGFEVHTRSTVNDALKTAKQINPDVLLSDVHMPGQDGFDFIRAAKADPQLRSIPFVFISSSVFVDSDRQRGLELGALKFILRPIEPLDLVAEIREVLARESK